MLAVLFGAADGLGYDTKQRGLLHLAARRELRQLTHALGGAASTQVGMARMGKSKQVRTSACEVLLGWCVTPAVPTYSAGVHIVQGDVPVSERKLAADLSWVLRILCFRADVEGNKEAPMLMAACEALCGTGDTTAKLEEAMNLGMGRNHTVSMVMGRTPTWPPPVEDHADAGDGYALA